MRLSSYIKLLKPAIILTLSAGTWLYGHSVPADSVSIISRQLEEITVSTIAPRKVLSISDDGSVGIKASLLGEQAAFMGANDPVALLRTLPAVATPNDLQASLSIRGGTTGDNLFESDGARIMNPLHMLGLYSAFNPAYYKSYLFRAGRIPVATGNCTSGFFSAESGIEPDSTLSGSISIGLIESHGAIRIPLMKRRSSLSVGVRHSYLSDVFPDILKLGDSRITYGFTDLNLAYTDRIADGHLLRLSFFGNRDKMGLVSDKNGSKSGDFGWGNIAAGAEWRHGRLKVNAAYSHYRNRFEMSEGGRDINLPSSMSQATAKALFTMREFDLSADANMLQVSGQNGFGRADAFEGSLSAQWRRTFGRLGISAGIRLTAYASGSYFKLAPMPRADVSFRLSPDFVIHAAYGRYMSFDRLIEESASGLPADFRALAGESLPPDDVHSAEIGISGIIPHTGISFILGGYAKRLLHRAEFAGSLIDLSNASYDPLADVMDGHGYHVGMSVMLMRQVGRVRGRVSYNLGRTRLRFDRYGSDYFPSAHDRLHDFNASLSWNITYSLMISASFTHADGLPYTRAKFGYMIGENLICEYYPHNSSRLPAYNRLDLAATYTFRTRAGHTHSVNVSVYNALASHNVLFTYTSYTVNGGIKNRSSAMKSVIPSISYTFTF